MKKTIQITLFSLLLSAGGCNSGDNSDEVITPTKPTSHKPELAKPPTDLGDTKLASKLDEELFFQFSLINDLHDKNQYWRGYEFKRHPQMYIHVSEETGKAVSAFIVNPYDNIKGQWLGNNESRELHVMKVDHLKDGALDKLKSGNGVFDFYHEIGGQNYYLQSYSTSNVENLIDPKITAAVQLAIHEVFHIYQKDKIKLPQDYAQLDNEKLKSFPINEEMLTYQVALLRLFKGLPHNFDGEGESDFDRNKEIATKLKQYSAIAHKMIDIDQNSMNNFGKSLIKTHLLGQELLEGIPQYIDNMTMTSMHPAYADLNFVGDDPINLVLDGKHGFSVAEFFSSAIVYNTGATVTWLLNEYGYDITKLASNQRYFHEVIEEILPTTLQEKRDILLDLKAKPEDASDEHIWAQVQSAAKRYYQLHLKQIK